MYAGWVYAETPVGLYVGATEECNCTLRDKTASYSALTSYFLSAFLAHNDTMTEKSPGSPKFRKSY